MFPGVVAVPRASPHSWDVVASVDIGGVWVGALSSDEFTGAIAALSCVLDVLESDSGLSSTSEGKGICSMR